MSEFRSWKMSEDVFELSTKFVKMKYPTKIVLFFYLTKSSNHNKIISERQV